MKIKFTKKTALSLFILLGVILANASTPDKLGAIAIVACSIATLASLIQFEEA